MEYFKLKTQARDESINRQIDNVCSILTDVFELMSDFTNNILTKKVMTIKVTTTEASTPRYWWCMDMDVECGCKVAA